MVVEQPTTADDVKPEVGQDASCSPAKGCSEAKESLENPVDDESDVSDWDKSSDDGAGAPKKKVLPS